MEYKELNNKIIINDLSQFNINQIFDCGQIFRYFINEDIAWVVSKNKFAKIITSKNEVEILTNDTDYFINFFDLDRDYELIKNKLKKDDFLKPCIDFGFGIRILKQDLFELIVSFIISANNNIKRIKNSLNFLAEKYGDKIDTNLGNYHAFPTLNQFKKIPVESYVEAGLGYRAEQLFKTIQFLTEEKLNSFQYLSVDEQKEFLLSLSGVGPKVANCIMLFSGNNLKSFPVDTWINKVYNHINKTNITDRKVIEKELCEKYGDLAGFAQQYFFYFYRENKLN